MAVRLRSMTSRITSIRYLPSPILQAVYDDDIDLLGLLLDHALAAQEEEEEAINNGELLPEVITLVFKRCLLPRFSFNLRNM